MTADNPAEMPSCLLPSEFYYLCFQQFYTVAIRCVELAVKITLRLDGPAGTSTTDMYWCPD